MNESKTSGVANVFFSYAHVDLKLVEQLKAHLQPLLHAGILTHWSDRDIQPGDNWSREIDEQLKSADIILAAISADYLASSYCYDGEMAHALKMQDVGTAIVLPIILRPCDWASSPIANLQVLPRSGVPVTGYDSPDEAFTEIANEIKRIAQSKEPASRTTDSTIEITLNRDFDSFSEDDQEEFLESIRAILETKSEFRVKGIRRGSVKLKLTLSEQEIARLQEAQANGELAEFNVVEAEVVSDWEAAEDNADTQRPKVFIGSSVEGLQIAETIQLNLDHLCEVTLWNQGIFPLSSGTLETLVKTIEEYDFGILVLTADDFTESRGAMTMSPRDNVIFELGLFMGHLGRDRTVIVYDRTANIKIPTDLAGVTGATFQPHSTGNLDAALGAPCTKLKQHVRSHGTRCR